MDLSIDDEQQALVDAFGRFFLRQSPPEVVRDAEPIGFSPAVWSGLTSMGAPGFERGDGDNDFVSLVTLALVAEQAGRWLVPAPLVESVVTARILRRAGCGPSILEPVLNGSRITTFALRPARGHRASLVPAGQIAGALVALDGDELVLAIAPPPALSDPTTLGSNGLADRSLLGAEGVDRLVVARGGEAYELFRQALDEWRVLTAALLGGLAQQGLQIGVEYVLGREQFGVAIGSFQSIQHRLADLDTAMSGASLLVREAAWAADEGITSSPALASMAFLFASDVAQQITDASLHFHGGYGFMLEYDIQLYYRRAKAWAIVHGDPARERQRLADLLWGNGAT